jgi:NAD(P)-dependent dehydrogenase (short-subunit alcohol dehydrogenase family)
MQQRGGYTDDDEYYKATAAVHPLGRNATTDDVAKAVAFLASNEATFITGEFIHLAGGLQNVCSSEFTNITP